MILHIKEIIMNKIRTLILSLALCFCAGATYAQHTPQQMAILQKDLHFLCEDRDGDVAFDTAYNRLNQYIAACDALIAKASTPELLAERAVWKATLAEVEATYAQATRWRIAQRTATAQKLDNDPKSWSTHDFATAILHNFEQALADAQSSKMPINNYTCLINDTDKDTAWMPTLYDFIACRFAAYLEGDPITVTAPATPFNPNQETFFTEDFFTMPLTTADTLNPHYRYFKLVQQWDAFHRDDADQSARLHLRLFFYEKLFALKGRQSLNSESYSKLCINTLKENWEKFKNTDGSEYLAQRLGYYYSMASRNDNADLYPEALRWYEIALNNSHDKELSDNCEEAIEEIKRPRFSFDAPDICYPEKQLIRLTSRNCDILYLYVVKAPDFGLQKKSTINFNPLHSEVIHVKTNHLYQDDTSLYVLPELNLGNYAIVVSEKRIRDNKMTLEQFCKHSYRTMLVTRLNFTYEITDKNIEVWVTDRNDGTPMANVSVVATHYYYSSHSSKDEIYGQRKATTDRQGHSLLEQPVISEKNRRNGYYILKITQGNDEISERCGLPYNYTSKPYCKASTYTDRNIYRPGQTVYWKSILVMESELDDQILSDKTVVVSLHDANWQMVTRDTLRTNEFGSVAGEFKLPQDGALGQYHIEIVAGGPHYSTFFRVEEYKRPTFEATIDAPKETYRAGQTVKISGQANAFAGYPVQSATVAYHVTREMYFPFRCYGWWHNPYTSNESTEIAEGACQTDDEGRFSFDFKALDVPDAKQFWPVYRYTITATVTDMSGETHETTTSLQVGVKSLRFDITLPEWLLTESDKLKFPLRTVNMSGEAQPAEVSYRVARLQMPEHYLKSTPYKYSGVTSDIERQFPQYAFHGEENKLNWRELSTITKGRLSTNDSSVLVLTELKKAPAGAYKLLLTTTDAFGEEVAEEFFFYLSPNHQKYFPEFVPLKVTAEKAEVEVGGDVSFTVGSYLDHAHVLVRIFSNDSLLEQKWLELNRNHPTQTLTVRNCQKRGAVRCFAHTGYNGVIYAQDATTKIPFSNKKIQIEFATFRDNLEPGEKTSVKIRFSNEFHEALSQAELLCFMYDASLDAIYPHANVSMSLNNTNYREAEFLNMYLPPWMSHSYQSVHFSIYSYIAYSYLDWKYKLIGDLRYRNYPKEISFSLDNTYTTQEEEGIAEVHNYVNEEVMPLKADEAPARVQNNAAGKAKGLEGPSVTPRTNFAETAFFYPFLTTNENGEIEMEFTLPESLTEWKMLGLAHTQDLRVGTFEKLLHTTKTLMVVPNAPRFVYENDELNFSAKIVNSEATALHGFAELKLFNAMNGEEILVQRSELSLTGNSTKAVSFAVKVPMGVTAITYRVTAQAHDDEASYSDGEENTIPVLSRRCIVTESVPLFITHKGSKTFSLDRLRKNSNSLISCRLQFTPTPQWNVVTALPYLTQYPYDCNEQVFSKLYANSVSSYIVRTHPKLEQLLNDCKTNHPEALQSKLRQNQDLMQILLTETPWLLDAQNEEQEIQDIFCLFDNERVTAEAKSMVQKLERNQNSDGGWPWFSGGKSSNYITEHILIGSARLMESGICQEGNNFLKKSTLKDAARFIDQEVEKDYQKMKKEYPEELKNYQIGSWILHYLYARSFYPEIKNNSESYRFYQQKLMTQAKKLNTFYQKTLAALTLYQMDTKESKELAKSIMQDLKKHALHSEEMGMYWKKEGRGYYWDESIVERQALMIEAFNKILDDKESVKEMKIWLLQQRRTQHWETTRATVEACFALMSGDETKTEKPGNITLQMCGETRNYVDTMQIPISEDVASCFDNATASDVVLTRDNDGLAYGGVTYKYYADIDSISGTSSDMPLSVERELWCVQNTEHGTELTLVTPDAPLTVGDKVRVRMVIRCDRDLEFVHLKDLRAAAFEPTEAISRYRWQDGLGYYQSFRDASVNFFFDRINKGTYVFEYTLFVTQSGTFSSGYASIQCMYAPEFSAHSKNSGKLEIGGASSSR